MCAAAHAEPANELSVGGAFRAMRSTSADAVTPDGLDGGQLVYARALLQPLPKLSLWVEAALNWGSADGQMFSEFDTHLHSFAVTGGGRARYELWRRLAIVGRIDVGAAHQMLELVQLESGETASDQAWGATATAALAIEAVAIDKPRFSLGLRLEAAYVATQAVRLEAKADRAASDDMIQLDTRSEALGHLDLGGPQATVSLVSRF